MLFSQGLACIQTRQLGFSRGAGRSGLVFPHIPAAIRGGWLLFHQKKMKGSLYRDCGWLVGTLHTQYL